MEAAMFFASIISFVFALIVTLAAITTHVNTNEIYALLDKITCGDKILCNNAYTEAVRRHGKNLTPKQAMSVLDEMQIKGIRKF